MLSLNNLNTNSTGRSDNLKHHLILWTFFTPFVLLYPVTKDSVHYTVHTQFKVFAVLFLMVNGLVNYHNARP